MVSSRNGFLPKILQLTSEQVRILRREAKDKYPVEACALLFGRFTEEKVVVTKIVMTPNILRSTTRFQVDPQLVFDSFERAEKEGLEFVGLFHSHPAPHNPSTTDIYYMKLWGDAVWLILSSKDNSIAAFQMANGKVRRIRVNIA
jgi:proteasome lid subunit RPN8/RPN11